MTTVIKHVATGWNLHVRENTSDRGVVGDILDDKAYRFDPSKVSDGGVIIDIGGNIGLFSMYAKKLCPGARVIAYEPEPDNRRMIDLNFRENGFDGKIVVWPKAVSNKSGVTEILQREGNSRLVDTGTSPLVGVYTSCETVTLEEVLDENKIVVCDFLKMDCEWAEYLILDVPPEVMSRFINIALEYHPVAAPLFNEFVERLRRTHNVEIVGVPDSTGYMFATRKG